MKVFCGFTLIVVLCIGLVDTASAQMVGRSEKCLEAEKNYWSVLFDNEGIKGVQVAFQDAHRAANKTPKVKAALDAFVESFHLEYKIDGTTVKSVEKLIEVIDVTIKDPNRKSKSLVIRVSITKNEAAHKLYKEALEENPGYVAARDHFFDIFNKRTKVPEVKAVEKARDEACKKR